MNLVQDISSSSSTSDDADSDAESAAEQSEAAPEWEASDDEYDAEGGAYAQLKGRGTRGTDIKVVLERFEKNPSCLLRRPSRSAEFLDRGCGCGGYSRRCIQRNPLFALQAIFDGSALLRVVFKVAHNNTSIDGDSF